MSIGISLLLEIMKNPGIKRDGQGLAEASGPLGKFGNSQPHHKRHWQGMRA
jgi:hypothetical protein